MSGNSDGTTTGAQAGKNAVGNNSLSKKGKSFDINSMLKIEVEDKNGFLLKGGGSLN